MPESLPCILIGLAAVALVAVGAYFAHRAEQQRRQALRELAAGMGWRFDPRRDASHDEEYAHFEIFRQGHSRHAYNTLTGGLQIAGRLFEVVAGDFTYRRTSGSGKNRHTSTHHLSYLILHLPWAVPDLRLRPEGLFDKLAAAFGFDDIDFESEEFSRRFIVKSPDKRFAYAVIHPRMMELLLQNRGASIDIEHSRCCVSDESRRWEPAQFRAQIEFLHRFFELWPEHLLAEIES